jgi:uncharacterized protein (TIGR02246 family)
MTDDEREIRSLITTWMSASQTGDLDTVLSLMSDDVVFMVPGREPFGKAEFAAASKGMGGVRMEGSSEIAELRVLGDWAWMRNRLKITVTPPTSQPVVREGYTLTILQKQNGKWQITRDANLLAPAK